MSRLPAKRKAGGASGGPARRPSPRTRSLSLRGGGRLRVSEEPGGDALRVLSAEGEVRLEVFVTADGAVLRLAGPRVAIEAAGALSLRCARFEVAAESIALGASGDVAVAAGRGLALRAGHDAGLSAQAVKVEARLGELALSANDDVALNGERVLLNCPTDEDVERRAREARTLADLLELPFQAPGGPRRLPPSEPAEEPEP